jgi:rhodanese-related sulfurtransferase
MTYLYQQKNRMRFVLAVLMALQGGAVAFAQVQSGAYRLMLKGLLSHQVPEITVQAAAADSAAVLFLDAREPAEYAVSHLKNAVFVGYDHFDPGVAKDWPKDRRIVVYCSVGYRSEKVTEKLMNAGFTRVANLYGGIFEWVNCNYPVYDDKGPTHRVHAYDRTWGIWLKKGKKIYK